MAEASPRRSTAPLRGSTRRTRGPGRPKTLSVVTEEMVMESQAFDTEARQLTRALRVLALQTRIWTPEQLERSLTKVAEQVEARWIKEAA